MKNGQEKLIAKIQHFYDVLTVGIDELGAEAITKESHKKRSEVAFLVKEGVSIKNKYKEIFKEFLYDEDNGKP